MERIEVLIDKLKQQFLNKAGADQLLLTAQLLQSELQNSVGKSSHAQTKKSVSIIIPSAVRINSVLKETAQVVQQEDDKLVEMLEVDEDNVRAELEQLKKNVEQHNTWSYNARQMAVVHDEQDYEIPTLSSHQSFQPVIPAPAPAVPAIKPEIKKEVNQVNLVPESSLNERLKEERTELAEKLQDTPVKDLKKAVGINDRYLYIIELFSGNEAAFDRSIKTLNSFAILPEAEFWMERELKLKLGWNEENPLVKQFIQLVRRRFS